jgi:molybdopterin-containing oxidoreductase family iron-sulfur binding subunit
MPPLEPKYWRSLAEREGRPPSPDEFPEGASEMDGATRREFLKLLGGTAALAGVAGCRNPPLNVLPYARPPDGMVPGNGLHYATTFTRDGYGLGVIVLAREGRPIKVEGHPDHPASLGATSSYEQGAIWHLYDPQRARTLRQGKNPWPWSRFVAAMAHKGDELKKDGGARLRFLVEPSSSPFEAALRAQLLQKFPRAKFYAWSPLGNESAYAATRLAFGRPLETRLDLDPARVIVSLDGDFLTSGPFALRYSRQFAEHRVPENDLNRLYAVEAGFSSTGAMADHRLRVRSAEVLEVACALAGLIAPGKVPAEVGARAGRFARDPVVLAMAKDLRARGAASLVIAGERQPPIVHALAAVMNAALGSSCMGYGAPVLSDTEFGPSALKALADEVHAGQVDTLVVTAWNPVYSAPADVDVAAMLRATNSIYRSLFDDETARWANWFLPGTHELEEWGDARAVDGTVSLRQPLILPLFGGVSTVEIWAALLGTAARGPLRMLRDHWRDQLGAGDVERAWAERVQKGVVSGSAAPVEKVSPTGDLTAALTAAPRAAQGLELNFFTDGKIYDGRYGDNGWLQEIPEPLTKMTWGNLVILSPKTAERLGLETEDLVDLSVAAPGEPKKVRVPAFVLPGIADETLHVAIGYGRKGAEMIAREIGTDVQPLRTVGEWWRSTPVELAHAGARRRLPITHDHWSMEGRPIALDVTVEDLEGKRAKHSARLALIEENKGAQPTMYAPFEYTGYKWAMSIDMSRCTGCSACVTACASENNTLIVGAEQVARGREMHWLRIDRYFTGPVEAPDVVMQPMMCVHCENAPCEYVCPVNATVHSDEGLNEMIYNRCVGTRYCSNNCPYKVRRFNYLNFHDLLQGTEQMAMNPDVSVRSRGVMEKCTYCVQRIERYRIETRVAGKGSAEWKDGDFTTACAQACPSNAIVFGSLHDPNARVSKLHVDERAYMVLHELGTRPRTVHLARVRNKNPEIAT